MRVEAIESIKGNTVRTYGEGICTNEIPDTEPFLSLGLKNPCIKLDSGKYVWGFQCWWSPSEKMQYQYPSDKYERIIVEVTNDEEVKPSNKTE